MSASNHVVESARRHAIEDSLDERYGTAMANAMLDHLHWLTDEEWLDYEYTAKLPELLPWVLHPVCSGERLHPHYTPLH